MKENFKFLKNHADTIVVLGGLLASIIWMNGTMNSFKDEIRIDIKEMHNDMAEIKTQIAIIKTVLIMKDIIPEKLANTEEK
jgi:hypothetical protein